MKRLWMLCVGLALIPPFSCTRNSSSNDGTIPSNPSWQDVPTFKVLPSNSDDTENLLKAFADAKASGRGAIVQLVFGKYFIRPIEVLDFDGYFQGYGQGITIISNLSDLPCDDFWNKNNLPYLIQFVGGNITVSDMTFHIQDGSPCRADSPVNRSKIGDLLGSIMIITDHTSNITSVNQQFKCSVSKVDFIAGDINGGVNPFGITGNTNVGVYCGSPFSTTSENHWLSQGDISITGCSFEQNVNGIYFWGFDDKSTLKISDNILSGSVYSNLALSCLGSNISISKNTYINALYSDVYINDNDNGNYPDLAMIKSSDYSISENDFSGTPKLASLYMIDNRRLHRPEEGFPQHFDIFSNTFHITSGGPAIEGLSTVGASITGNFFDSTHGIGIMIDGDQNNNIFSSGINISGNMFESAKNAIASIMLGHYTTDCKVVCAPADKVVNFGINNTVSPTQSQ